MFPIIRDVGGRLPHLIIAYNLMLEEPAYLVQFDGDGTEDLHFVMHNEALLAFPDHLRVFLTISNIEFFNKIYNVHLLPDFDLSKFKQMLSESI